MKLVDDFDLARKWAKELGFAVSDGEEPRSLILKGAGVSPGVVVKDGTVTVSCGLIIEDREETKKPEKLVHLLTGRSAFVFVPPENPRELVVYQRIKISVSDPSTFNRYSDAVQEVINATLLTAKVLTGNVKSGLRLPEGMYR